MFDEFMNKLCTIQLTNKKKRMHLKFTLGYERRKNNISVFIYKVKVYACHSCNKLNTARFSLNTGKISALNIFLRIRFIYSIIRFHTVDSHAKVTS